MNEGAKYGNGDGSKNRAGTGTGTATGTGVETRGRSQDGNGDGSGDRNESSFGDENGDEDRNGDGSEGGIGEGGGEVKKRKKPYKNCRRNQVLLFRTRYHLGRQRVVLAGTRQLRSQGLVPVHAHRTEGVTGSERQKGSNGVGSGIGVVGGMGTGSGSGTGMERERERERGGRRTRERKMGTGTGAGMETRAIVEIGMETSMGMGARIESGRAEERRRSARNRKMVVDAMWETGETWVERGKHVEKKGLVE